MQLHCEFKSLYDTMALGADISTAYQVYHVHFAGQGGV